MKSSQPPAAAPWLLKSLTPNSKSEALLGDLEEDFALGRSVAWYWRKVLAAILVSFAQELRIRWTAIGFATLWTAAVFLFLQYFYTGQHNRRLFDDFFGWATTFSFPISMIYVGTFTLSLLSALEATTGLVGVGIYLLSMKSFGLRRFMRTASIALATVFVGNIVVAAFVVSTVPTHLTRFVGFALGSILVFVTLLAAVWTPSVTDAGAKSQFA